MTIAIVLKVGDGVVLGADSATTLLSESGYPDNVYFNAEKVFNLVKGMPLGVVTYGLGGLDGRSVTSLAKELRSRLSGSDPAWRLDRTNHTVEQASKLLRDFFYKEFYGREFPVRVKDKSGKDVEQYEPMGFIVAGFSADARHPEVWRVDIGRDGSCADPSCSFPKDSPGGLVWEGQPEALRRLVNGWSTEVFEGLLNAGIPKHEVVKWLSDLPVEPIVNNAMPIQDAIDLVQYLADVTAGFVRFLPGPPSVHPPIDAAAITRYEGFRWARRKHYYSPELNPPLPKE